MNRREFLKKSLEGIVIGSILLISGYTKNPAKSETEEIILSISKTEWYTTTNKTESGLIFGHVRLKISGSTNGDRVTYLDYGDGIIMERELKLSETKEFEEDVPVIFTHSADNIPRKYHTVVTAYRENDKISIEIESEELTYLTRLEELIKIPEKYLLFQNYPNPFNSITNIEYELHAKSNVELKIYNILGQEIRTLVEKEQSPGDYHVKWNGKNNAGQIVSGGIYLYQLKAGDFVTTKKLTFLK